MPGRRAAPPGWPLQEPAPLLWLCIESPATDGQANADQ
jgi:hypothetical protein